LQILAFKGGREAGSELINLNKETEASCSNRSENSSEINLDISRTPPSEGRPMDPPPANHHQHAGNGSGMIPFYPSVGRPAGVDIDQLLHSSSGPKMEQHSNGGGVQAPEASSFGNLLCGADEPPPFWPWADQQHFH
jgi:homeobox-leucine zipper protein